MILYWLMRPHGPLKYRDLWIWFFPNDWRWGSLEAGHCFSVGPLFIDWYVSHAPTLRAIGDE